MSGILEGAKVGSKWKTLKGECAEVKFCCTFDGAPAIRFEVKGHQSSLYFTAFLTGENAHGTTENNIIAPWHEIPSPASDNGPETWREGDVVKLTEEAAKNYISMCADAELTITQIREGRFNGTWPFRVTETSGYPHNAGDFTLVRRASPIPPQIIEKAKEVPLMLAHMVNGASFIRRDGKRATLSGWNVLPREGTGYFNMRCECRSYNVNAHGRHNEGHESPEDIIKFESENKLGFEQKHFAEDAQTRINEAIPFIRNLAEVSKSDALSCIDEQIATLQSLRAELTPKGKAWSPKAEGRQVPVGRYS